MKFVLVEQPGFKSASWWLLIEGYADLLSWYENQSVVRDGVIDYFKVGRGEQQHAVTALGGLICHHAEHVGQLGALDLSVLVHNTFLRPKVRVLQKHGAILINPLGGFCPLQLGHHSITARIESDEWPIIDGEVRLLQWAKGGHWYAKVGPHDVVVDGEQKWDTKLAAQAAAGRFLQERSTA